MDFELESYKKSIIDNLTITFNAAVKTLQAQLVGNINYINSLRINISLKKYYIQLYTSNYNTAFNKLKSKFISDVTAINLLTSVPGKRKPSKFALLIGINYKGTSNELYGCINDTQNIKTLLEDKYGYKNFTFLTDDTNNKPTKPMILKEFTNLLSNAISGDSLFFLYSGHGTCTTDFNKDELDGRDELIVPIDATTLNSCILDDELNAIIKTNLKPGVKLFALFDSCFSGTVLDLKYNYLDSSNLDKLTTNPNVTETNGQVCMISGCTDNQTSADTVITDNTIKINNGAMGAMTYSFLNTIRNSNTNSLTLKSLVQNMRGLLKDNGFTQKPQLSSGILLDINSIVSF